MISGQIICIPSSCSDATPSICFDDIPSAVWTKNWVVNYRQMDDGLGSLKYLVPYLFRVAISNHRILSLVNDRVKCRYRDTDTGQ
ncbi:MAG: hypothetical protein GY759_01550 [Chloroflexi bacterium]|nr:hypothetical protein [Chloroflexota bacterium]